MGPLALVCYHTPESLANQNTGSMETRNSGVVVLGLG